MTKDSHKRNLLEKVDCRWSRWLNDLCEWDFDSRDSCIDEPLMHSWRQSIELAKKAQILGEEEVGSMG